MSTGYEPHSFLDHLVMDDRCARPECSPGAQRRRAVRSMEAAVFRFLDEADGVDRERVAQLKRERGF